MSTSVRNIVILLLVWLVVLWLDLPSIFKHLMLHSHNHMTETTKWTLRDVVQTTLEGLPEEDTPMPTVQHWTPPAGPSVHVHDQYPTPVQTNRIRRRTQDAPMSGATTVPLEVSETHSGGPGSLRSSFKRPRPQQATTATHNIDLVVTTTASTKDTDHMELTTSEKEEEEVVNQQGKGTGLERTGHIRVSNRNRNIDTQQTRLGGRHTTTTTAAVSEPLVAQQLQPQSQHSLPKSTPVLPLKPTPIPPQGPQTPAPGGDGKVIPPNHFFPLFPQPKKAPVPLPVRDVKQPKNGNPQNNFPPKNPTDGKGKVTTPENNNKNKNKGKGNGDPKNKNKGNEGGLGGAVGLPVVGGTPGRGKHPVTFNDPPFHCESPTAAPMFAAGPVTTTGTGTGTVASGTVNGVNTSADGVTGATGGASTPTTPTPIIAGVDGTSTTQQSSSPPTTNPTPKPNTLSPTTTPTNKPNTRSPTPLTPSMHIASSLTQQPSSSQPTAYPTTYYYGSASVSTTASPST